MKITKTYSVEMLSEFTGWLDSLETNVKIKMITRINRLKVGNFGDCKAVGEGVSELRIHAGPGYRVYFAQIDDTIVLLLTGGTKKTQKKDIEKAQELLREVKNG